MADPDTVVAPRRIWRVARSDAPLQLSGISATDDRSKRAGNRFDTALGGVLYCATTPLGCFAETLARFRPSAKVRAIVRDEQEGFMVCGGVPADWRARRVKIGVSLPNALPFLDAESPNTHEFLTSELALELAALHVATLDVGVMRGPDRRVTRAVATWAFQAEMPGSQGTPRFSGIRYVSRLGDHECWAVFEGTPIVEVSREPVPLADADFRSVTDQFGLHPF